jgi:hypothetical protein
LIDGQSAPTTGFLGAATPQIWGQADFIRAGYLSDVPPRRRDVDRILRSKKPGDIPVKVQKKFELAESSV